MKKLKRSACRDLCSIVERKVSASDADRFKARNPPNLSGQSPFVGDDSSMLQNGHLVFSKLMQLPGSALVKPAVGDQPANYPPALAVNA